MKKYLLLYIVAFLVFSISAKPVNAYNNLLSSPEGSISKVFTVNSGETLEIDFEIGTTLVIEGWNKNEVDVKVEAKQKDLDNIEFEFVKDGNKVKLEAEYKQKKNNVNSDEMITTIKVPEKFDISFLTKGGEVSLTNIEGEFSGKTMGGKFEFDRLNGKVDCTTMGGEIKITNSQLCGRVKTMGGNIKLDHVDGSLNVETMGGNIEQANVNMNKKEGEDGVTIKTMGGNIKLDKLLNGGKVSTMGGNISIDHVKGYAETVTMGGSINIEKLDGGVSAKTMGGSVSVKCENVTDKIKLTAMSGMVELYIPADSDVEIRISVNGMFTGDDDFTNFIESDFKLDYKIKDDMLIATGTNGTGKNTIELSSNMGKVILHKL